MSDATAVETKKPGRKSETPQQRLARLERDLVLAKKAVQEAEQRKLATIGGAVLAEAAEDSTFRTQLQKLLRARVTSKTGQIDIASLLEGR